MPLSLGPGGTLLWRNENGLLFSQDYLDNWKAPVAVPDSGPQVDEVETANGYFRLRWTRGRPGAELVARAHGRREVLSSDITFTSRPVLAANGRTLIGESRAQGASTLRTFAVRAPLAAVRLLSSVGLSGEEAGRLAREGVLFTPTDADQIYRPYERLAYEDLGCGSRGGMLQPVFASLYPIAWSLDSELLEASVMRGGVAPECGSVPGRMLPTGLDLLAGLGSAKAGELNRKEYQRFSELERVHERGAASAAGLEHAATFVDSFLRLVQILSTAQYVPEAVSKDLWQRRLLQSSLGAWVGLRHTLVLVSEEGSAECDFRIDRFENWTWSLRAALSTHSRRPNRGRARTAWHPRRDRSGKSPCARADRSPSRRLGSGRSQFGRALGR